MSPDLQERVYQTVERAVLWGEPREEVFRIMETNGITGEEAEAVFQRALAERLSILRGDGLRVMIKGLVILGVSVCIFSAFWYGLGVMTRAVFVLCGLGAIWGAWLAIDGLTNIVLAPTKSGSVLEDS